jgi:hypothetical protein
MILVLDEVDMADEDWVSGPRLCERLIPRFRPTEPGLTLTLRRLLGW